MKVNLRKKTLIIIGAGLVCLILVLYASSQMVLTKSLREIENRDMRENVERALDAISIDQMRLSNTTAYWAVRNDTYSFVSDQNSGYMESNLGDGTFKELEINLVVFMNSYGRIVYAKAFDIQREEEVKVPEALRERLSLYGFCPGCLDKQRHYAGLILLPDGPMLIVSHPILKGNREGPSRGRLVMGRYLNSHEIRKLAKVTHLNLTAHDLNDEDVPEDFSQAELHLSDASPIFIREINNSYIAGYALLKDIYGDPIVMLRIENPRDIYMQSESSMLYIVLLFAAAGFIFIALTLLYLDKSVLSGLAVLSASVRNIRTRSDLSTRVPVPGEDELASLAGSINEMLSTLESVQANLSRSEERYRAIVEDQTELICRYLPDGTITFVNEAYARYFGRSKEDLFGKSFMPLIPEEDREILEKSTSSLSPENPFVSYQHRVLSPMGVRWQQWTDRGIFNGSGDMIEIQSVGRDITEKRQAEEELRRAHDELETRVRERTAWLLRANEALHEEMEERELVERELKKAKDHALEASRAKSEFLANMSHEIRTPMNAVIGMTGLLLEEDMTPDQRECLETIRNSGNALLAIINDILDLSKIEGEKMELECQPFDLRACLEDSLDLVASQATEKDLNLAYMMDEGVPEQIVGDPTRLRQILANLLGNAVKFTSSGEVTARVDCNAFERGEIHFIVKDTGIGIPEEAQGKLFLSFSQVDTSTTRKYGGTGLGLAISKNLVELMGGKIWVESELGSGSEFHFTIKAQPSLGKPKSYLSADQPILKGKKLMIAAESETTRNILCRYASIWSMSPVAASTVEMAINLAHAEKFDLAVIDRKLKDCHLLAEEIRRCQKELPLVLLSSKAHHQRSDLFSGQISVPVKPSQVHEALIGIFDRAAPKSPAEHKPPSRPQARANMRILLAEDNAVNQMVTLRMLRRLGYRADVAGNGLEVLESLERQDYDVILMDVQMPEMDGLEAAKEIHRRWPDSDLKIVAVTAHALEGDKEMCLKAGMDDYISKPVQMEELTETLLKFQRREEVRLSDAEEA